MTLGLNDEVPVVICVDGAVGDGRGEGLVASEDMGKTFLVLGSWFLVLGSWCIAASSVNSVFSVVEDCD